METGRRIMLLVRHGSYDMTIDFPANPDGHLNDKGRKQSQAVANWLQSVKLDAIHTSSLMRARETAELIAILHPNIALHVDDALQECIPSVPQGLEKLFERIPEHFIAEGGSQAASVFNTYFAPIAEDAPTRTEVIVSHGNLLGYLISRVFDAPIDSWLRADFGNGAISEIRIRYDGIMKLMYHNHEAHLLLLNESDM